MLRRSSKQATTVPPNNINHVACATDPDCTFSGDSVVSRGAARAHNFKTCGSTSQGASWLLDRTILFVSCCRHDPCFKAQLSVPQAWFDKHRRQQLPVLSEVSRPAVGYLQRGQATSAWRWPHSSKPRTRNTVTPTTHQPCHVCHATGVWFPQSQQSVLRHKWRIAKHNWRQSEPGVKWHPPSPGVKFNNLQSLTITFPRCGG
jgi:hypothetical protein